MNNQPAPAARAPVPPPTPAEFDAVDLVVVLPTLNEEVGLARTLDEIPFDALRASGWEVRPLVIDGGSTDRTREVAQRRGIAILNQTGQGKGAAIREALTFLAERKARYAVIMDADFTYPGAMVPAMAQLLDAGSQLVVGVRQPVRSARDDSREFVHRVGNRLLNLTASQLAGLPILDLCSGFWGVVIDTVPPLALESNGFEIEAELFTKAYRAGYTVTQIPIAYRERVGIAKLRAIRDGARILVTAVRHGRRQLSATLSLSRPSELRDLLSIALLEGGSDFVLLSDASRRKEAEAIAERLRQSRPEGSVAVRSSADPPVPVGAGRPIVIRLPAIGLASRPPRAIVHLPRTGRRVEILDELGARSPSAPTPSPGELTLSGGYQLEYSPHQWVAAERVRALVANTFPTEPAKELAFLGANAHRSAVIVWRAPGDELDSLGQPLAQPTREARGAVLADESLSG
jgi:hypothetical protein